MSTLKTIAKRALDYAGCRKAWFSLSASARSRYYLKNLYLRLFAIMSRVKGFETITRHRVLSVVEKPFTVRMAFTLAEVLIVLGIIGLIADMTIPTLHQNITEKVTVTKIQKAYSTLESAVRMGTVENGPPETWPLGEGTKEGADNLWNIISPHLNILQDCGNTYCEGTPINEFTRMFALTDGTVIDFQAKSKDCSIIYGATEALKHVCASFSVDINGLKKPNIEGKDKFAFNLTKNGIVPRGLKEDTMAPFPTACNRTNIKNGSPNTGCSAWVLYNGNMDYLHCDDLSWDGKKRCK